MRSEAERARRRAEKRRYYERHPDKKAAEILRHDVAHRIRRAIDPHYHEKIKAMHRQYYNERKDDPAFRVHLRELARQRRRRLGIPERQPAKPKIVTVRKPPKTIEEKRARWRRNRLRWVAANREKVIDTDRRYRARRREKLGLAPRNVLPPGVTVSQLQTAAMRFLRSQGLIKRGPQDTTDARRKAALAYVRAAGLLNASSAEKVVDDMNTPETRPQLAAPRIAPHRNATQRPSSRNLGL